MKVIIADDHPVVRQGLRQMLAVEQDLQVVGEARNGQEVVDLSRRVPWEVAVLDYNMPGKNGLELIKELRQRYPGRAVLILSCTPRIAMRCVRSRPEPRVISPRRARPRSSSAPSARSPAAAATSRPRWARSSRSSSKTTAASRCTRRFPTASTR